jgi:thioredoxin 1
MPAITLTNENFDKEVKQSSLPVLVSYQNGANSDSVDTVSDFMNGTLKCCKINVGDNPELAGRYKIRSVPTILLFRGGRVTDTIVGDVKTEQLMKILK